ncbi:hypothetical protein PoB_001034900 [Plakobranchus ocellatus]|uniref:Uncharacterized protein n=1 Tax=Plakobranchus ocellatus TaxID=259542 RepID=A0AAV3YP82_9GAST|nr:hypothetical protein PoB_001034900 [Plakobranchus ocellatus]
MLHRFCQWPKQQWLIERQTEDANAVDPDEIQDMTEFKVSAVSYIAGYVVKMARKQDQSCKKCVDSLIDEKCCSGIKLLSGKLKEVHLIAFALLTQS